MIKIKFYRLLCIILLVIVIVVICLMNTNTKKKKMISLLNYNKQEVINYCNKNDLKLIVKEKVSSVKEGNVVSQSIEEGTIIKKGDVITVYISKEVDYEELEVNEMGSVPIMMYHGIHDIKDNKYTGGNVDYDGYQRTTEAFKKDLEFYYQNGYRMIRLEDYVNGKIDVEAGLSPIVITFDDGLENNIKVTGLDADGNIIIDPNSAVGILNEFKNKYPDYNVTATFFVNGKLFNQPDYNEKILKYMVDNNYDIGNHTYSHVDFTSASISETQEEVGSVYEILDEYIKDKYVHIVALPYGTPYRTSSEVFPYILNGEYNNKTYNTISTLRVGWEAEFSPFDSDFDKTFLKRIRAYDNNGEDFDIEMNFDILKNTRYISDGDVSTVTIPKDKEKYLNDTKLKIVTY